MLSQKLYGFQFQKIGKKLFDMLISAIVIENRNSDLLAELVTKGALLCLLEGDEGRIGVALIAEKS